LLPYLKSVNIDCYIHPLREGGSLPGLVKGDDGQSYVVKFRGAAQGVKALIAELIGGELARLLGLRVPELVFAHLDNTYAKLEGDIILQEQFAASTGINIGLKYLPGSIMFDPAVTTHVDSTFASRTVWLDCLITNMDRTARNPNLLVWNKELWLIDHGAGLYFHHNWTNKEDILARAKLPFALVRNHVLLPHAHRLKGANKDGKDLLTGDAVRAIVQQIPDEWLPVEPPFQSPDEYRKVYEAFLLTRIANSGIFVKEALNARKKAI
jgi:hypothetical protein